MIHKEHLTIWDLILDVDEWRQPEGLDNYLVSTSSQIVRFYSPDKLHLMHPYERGRYLCVKVTKNGKRHTKGVHQLVALAWKPNPNHYPCVNHIDENRKNNVPDNLEWCTYAYNNSYRNGYKRRRKALLVHFDKQKPIPKLYVLWGIYDVD